MAGRISRRAKVGRAIRRGEIGTLPDFVPPQLTALTETAPEGDEWAHELKWDGYRMHARIEGRNTRLLTRTGLDWTEKYPAIVKALRALPVSQAYLDGELCALSEQGLTSFSAMQAATDARSTEGLVLVLFDLLFLDGEDLTGEPLRVKERLEALLASPPPGLQYSEHHLVSGETFYRNACKLGIEGIVSKRLDCPYKPGDRGFWRKVKCLLRQGDLNALLPMTGLLSHHDAAAAGQGQRSHRASGRSRLRSRSRTQPSNPAAAEADRPVGAALCRKPYR